MSTQADTVMEESTSQGEKRAAETQVSTILASKKTKLDKQLVPVTTKGKDVQTEESKPIDDILSWPTERLVTEVNPTYLKDLRATGEGGYCVPDSELTLTQRPYEIEVSTLRGIFASVLNRVLVTRLSEKGSRSLAGVKAISKTASDLCADVCMSALYAKLRTLHRAKGKYRTRYTTPPSYSKSIELPLPFAVAIENFGQFETSATLKRYCVFPVHPEGNKFEGRSKDDLDLTEYESVSKIFTEADIPMKNIEPHVKSGTAWWTYVPLFDGDSYDLHCIYPTLHYSDHSAVIASMFLNAVKDQNTATTIVKHQADDVDYGVHLKDVRNGIQLRSFEALCQHEDVYWNLSSNI